MIDVHVPRCDPAIDGVAGGAARPKRRMPTPVVLVGLLIASLTVAGVAVWSFDRNEARQYRRFCIERTTDQGRCNRGPAVEPRRRCLVGEWPPGVEPQGSLATCVQTWLASEGK